MAGPGDPGADYQSTTGFWTHMRGLPYECTEMDIVEVQSFLDLLFFLFLLMVFVIFRMNFNVH